MYWKFIADVHLGKLARLLRLLGFDTLYKNDLTHEELVKTALADDRILLSRSAAFKTKAAPKSFHIEDEDPSQQLRQIVFHFKLVNEFHPFSRCIVCNGIMQTVSKENILHKL